MLHSFFCCAIIVVEQLPLVSAILIHGAGLYAVYILIYLLNGWLKHQLISILIFTAVFVAGYAVIWFIIYTVTKAKTQKINNKLQSDRKYTEARNWKRDYHEPIPGQFYFSSFQIC